ncbi:MAG: GGDEF domain-containing protein [Zoogloeaceae bacterium]|nr:GGDEF domain-containing protein [Zoogloeaceae bacterium]
MSHDASDSEQESSFLRWATSLIASELLPGDFPSLLSPFRHLPLLASRRASMIGNRARFIALLFALVTPLWSVIDYVFFPFALWLYLFGLRLLVSLALFALVYFYVPNSRIRDAYRAMGILALVPASFFLASHIALSPFQLEGASAVIAIGYSFLPFVFLSCLAIFPLTALESLIFAFPILVAQCLAGFVNWSHAPVSDWILAFGGDIWLLTILAGISMLSSMSQLALMLALVRQAAHDPLTRVFTRRSGEELLEMQFSNSLRSNTPIALAFIDLDHFKTVNDQSGHEAGDIVLKNAAATISQMLRSGDILVRWGGEEFLVIMPHTHVRHARAALTRLLQSGLGQHLGRTMTASIGIAERLRDEVPDRHRLVEIADRRMYLAKKGGRNQILDNDWGHAETTGAEGPPSNVTWLDSRG